MQHIEHFLREKNLKKTPLRLAILEIFSENPQPLTIVDLEKFLLEKNFSPSQTSLYRQMECLTKNNILQLIILRNFTAHYELQADHHHHFVCESCEKIECVDDKNLEIQIHSLEKKMNDQGIQIFSHQFSLHGKCKECA